MSEKLRDTPYFKYLAEILDKTNPDSEQWDAINGAMHQMEDQEAENNALRKRVGELEGELKKAGIRLKLNQKLCCDCTHHPPDNPDKEPWGTCRTCNSNHDNWHSKFVPLTPPATEEEADNEQ